MDAAAVVAGDDAGIGVGLAGGVQGLIVLEGIGGGDGAKAAQPGGHAAQGRLVHRSRAGSVRVLVQVNAVYKAVCAAVEVAAAGYAAGSGGKAVNIRIG